MTSVTDISYYTEFRRVCRVAQNLSGEWYYTDIDQEIMYRDHRSWVYLIVVDGEVWKIGETGNPLGIASSRDFRYTETPEGDYVKYPQPSPGTTNRLGRYRKGCGTDARCREQLRGPIDQGALVEFWAYACPEMTSTPVILEGQEKFTVRSQMHKQLEVCLLDNYHRLQWNYPPLNKARC
jgi:hypothetical protein